jgi:pimeloyl-ACP methyl ester carboxylesterase
MPVATLSTGIDMYYEAAGSGEPLVLHYGTNGAHGAWEPQVSTLARQLEVITPDPRGTGQTGGAAEDWTMELMAADIIALLDALGIERAHVGGMSMGSAVCQEIAIRFPERVRTVILANTWGRTDHRLRLLWEHQLFLIEQAARSSKETADAWNETLYRYGIATFFSSHAIENRPEMIQRWWDVYSAGVREDAGLGHWDAMLRHDALSRLTSVKAPTLILAGEEDYFTTYYPRQVHQQIPGADYVCLEGVGSSHGMLWERAGEANEVISQFIRKRSSE